MKDEKWIEHYQSETVSLHELKDGDRATFYIGDRDGQGGVFQHYRIVINTDRERKTPSLSIGAEYSDEDPGTLASYTPMYENSGDGCEPGEVVISDDGLLSVLARQPSASSVQIRIGWTALLPKDYIEPIRLAITLAEAALRA